MTYLAACGSYVSQNQLIEVLLVDRFALDLLDGVLHRNAWGRYVSQILE